MASMLVFNATYGFLDAILRGYRTSLVTKHQYANFCQCETLEDLKTQLACTEYGERLRDVPAPLTTSALNEVLRDQFVDEFRYLQRHATDKLARFLEYMTYEYQIDNVVLIITGMLHESATAEELTSRCHPLGIFEALPALTVARNVAELYNTVLAETPLGPYFRDCLTANDLDDFNLEIIRNTLYRAYLEDFDRFCRTECNDTTLGPLLQFEADRRILSIAINAIGTDLSKDDRLRLFPKFGKLYESGVAARLARLDDISQIRTLACSECPEYRPLLEAALAQKDEPTGGGFSNSNADIGIENEEYCGDQAVHAGARSLEEFFFEREVELCRDVFQHQFTFAPFYAYVKLKEQEIRNIVWIAECIAQKQKENIHHYIPTV